jgi:hypothetical protein
MRVVTTVALSPDTVRQIHRVRRQVRNLNFSAWVEAVLKEKILPP